MVTAQDSQFADRVMKIFLGLGAKNVTLSSIPDVTFFMDEISEGHTAKCAVKCETEKAWIGRDTIYTFYKAMQSYMPYSGMKRGYFITTGSFMKDAKVKVAEINAEHEDFEIILVNSSDLDQYETKEVEVTVESPKPQKKKQKKQQEPAIAATGFVQPAVDVVETPKQKTRWLAKKSKKEKQPKPQREKLNNPLLELIASFTSEMTSVMTDLPLEYLVVFVGLVCVIFVVIIIMIFHSTGIPITMGNQTVYT